MLISERTQLTSTRMFFMTQLFSFKTPAEIVWSTSPCHHGSFEEKGRVCFGKYEGLCPFFLGGGSCYMFVRMLWYRSMVILARWFLVVNICAGFMGHKNKASKVVWSRHLSVVDGFDLRSWHLYEGMWCLFVCFSRCWALTCGSLQCIDVVATGLVDL